MNSVGRKEIKIHEYKGRQDYISDRSLLNWNVWLRLQKSKVRRHGEVIGSCGIKETGR